MSTLTFTGVMTAMIVIFVYFLVMIWTRQLGEAGTLPVPVAVWAENVVLIAAAAFGLRRLR